MSPTSSRQLAAGTRQQAAAVRKVRGDLHHHAIHKCGAGASSSSSTSSSVSSSPVKDNGGTGDGHLPATRQKVQLPPPLQQPVIIYTHSPKVIRTTPRDFMSIVQKLTGLESAAAATTVQDDSSSSSNESCVAANAHVQAAVPTGYTAMDQLLPPATPLDAHFFPPGIPLFTPVGEPVGDQLLAGASLYGHLPPTVDTDMINLHNGSVGAFSPSLMLDLETMRTTFPSYQLT